jgi:hypothetical protein
MPLLIAGAASAGISAIMGGVQMYQGNKQKKAGEDALKNLNKPTYQIPDELRQNLKESELRALEGLPTEQKMEYVKNIERSQQQALQASAERKGGLMGIQQATSQANDMYTNLVSMDAAQRAANEAIVQQNRGVLANAKDREFGVKEDRYQQGLASGQAMVGAGNQNFMQGLDTIAGSVIQAGGMIGQNYAMKGAKGSVDNSLTPLTSDQISAMQTALKIPIQYIKID